MKKTLISLLKLLLQNNTSMTAESISLKLDVSIRTVKNYIYEINKQHPDTIKSSRNGYTANFNNANQLLQNELEKQDELKVPQGSPERVNYILQKLLGSQSSINLYDLCDELYISRSTLNNELAKVKQKILDYDLNLKNESDALSFVGLEKNKRKLLSTMIYEKTGINFANLNIIQKAYPQIDIKFIQLTILDTFNSCHIYINDYSLANLVLHIAIAIDRIKHGYTNNSNVLHLIKQNPKQFHIAQELTNEFEQYFQLTFFNAEIYELCLLIASSSSTIDYTLINQSNIQNYIGLNHYNLIQELMHMIEENYSIKIDDPEFFARFSLHIENLIVRSKNNHFCKNPLTEEIKKSCPLIYDISVMLASLIKEKIHISINDDEIAFIAFHLGSAFEIQKLLSTKINAVLYCPNYYDLNSKLLKKINRSMSEDVILTNIITSENELKDLKKCELIITTIPFSNIPAIPFILINIFFNAQSQMKLNDKINDIKLSKKKMEFKSYLKKIIHPDFFEKSRKCFEKNEALSYMGNKLLHKGYVNASFFDDVLEREQISSTALGTFAIPHTLKMKANKTNISVLITEKPIDWDGKKVRLVLMLCFNANERAIFHKIFDPLTIILSEPKNVESVLACNTYEELLNIIVSCL